MLICTLALHVGSSPLRSRFSGIPIAPILSSPPRRQSLWARCRHGRWPRRRPPGLRRADHSSGSRVSAHLHSLLLHSSPAVDTDNDFFSRLRFRRRVNKCLSAHFAPPHKGRRDLNNTPDPLVRLPGGQSSGRVASAQFHRSSVRHANASACEIMRRSPEHEPRIFGKWKRGQEKNLE